jgi:DNA-binding MarR family transcriptional regulator
MSYPLTNFSQSLALIAHLARANALLMRRFESGLPGGLGFNDFMILFNLHQSSQGKMRRVDLADKLGVTTSGITRIVAPLEKLSIVKREESEHDGRVVYVTLAPGGKRLFSEALESAEYNSEKIIPAKKASAYQQLVSDIRV